MVSKKHLELIQRLLRYDAESGTLTWTSDIQPNIRAGDVAGSYSDSGRAIVGIDHVTYSARQIAWFLHHGQWPNGTVYTKIRANGLRLENLTLSRPPHPCKPTAHTGLRKTHCGHWRAMLNAGARRYYIGTFPTYDAAAAARDEARALASPAQIPALIKRLRCERLAALRAQQTQDVTPTRGCYLTRSFTWRVNVTHNRKTYFIGIFKTQSEAKDVYEAARLSASCGELPAFIAARNDARARRRRQNRRGDIRDEASTKVVLGPGTEESGHGDMAR